MTLSVIGAGFGRTGTLSLKLALEQLGFGPSCHGSDTRHLQQDPDFWQRAFSGAVIDWDAFFQGYRSTIDSPSCKFYLQLAERYPAAKIVLTVREPNAWFDSYAETVLPMIVSAHGGKHFHFLFGDVPPTRAALIAAYERHNSEVQQSIPANRLLVYDVQHGWPPLCRFLGVRTPDTAFPRSNPREEFPLLLDQMLERAGARIK
jgi:hypothetical protein